MTADADTAPPTGPCQLHPNASATERCPSCGAGICEHCVTPVGDGFLCRDCARTTTLRRRLLKGGAVLAVLVIIGVVGYLAASAIKAADTKRIAKGQNKGRMTDEQRQAQDIANHPCDEKRYRAWVVEHADGDCKKIMARAQYFFDRCGPYLRLRWSTFGCYKRRGQYKKALAEVTRLIDAYPYDKDFRWWRAEIHVRMKQYNKGLDDYLQAVLLGPSMRRVPLEMEWTARRARRPCRVVFPMLQHAHYHTHYKLDLSERRRRHKAIKACPQTLGTGTVTGPRFAGRSAPPARVSINSKASGDFALDLETGLVLLSAELAKRAGLPRGRPTLAWYGEELVSGHLVTLKEVEWGGARARDVEALVIRGPTFAHDGVLGRSFLLRFSGKYNEDGTQVTLIRRIFPSLQPDAPDDF